VIAVAAAGTITPVGTNLVDTMSALYTRVQLFEDLDALDDDGEPLSGMKIPFKEELRGGARLAVMAHAIVDECVAAIEPVTDKVPLLLCCPEADDDTPARLLDEVIAQAAIPIDRGRSRVFPAGRAATLEALGAALALLKDPVTSTCLVGGVDSLIDEQRLQVLLDEDRLLTTGNKDGFIAGEAGVMLALTNQPGPDALAAWLAAAAGTEEACRGSDRPVTGAGLQKAMTQALALANLRFEDLACLAHDFSGEARTFEELTLAGGRMGHGKDPIATEDPGLSVGETGAAAGFLPIAMLAFLHSKGVHARPSLALLSCDGPARGAVVLGPMPRPRW
jgi:3-oxoacyl-[acyl-carrier-protein] synthase-1